MCRKQEVESAIKAAEPRSVVGDTQTERKSGALRELGGQAMEGLAVMVVGDKGTARVDEGRTRDGRGRAGDSRSLLAMLCLWSEKVRTKRLETRG